MIDKELKNAPVVRVPKTDLIRVVVSSPDWSASISRRLVAPFPARTLEPLLSIDALMQSSTSQDRSCVTIVQATAGSQGAICRLAVENALKPTPDLMLVIGPGLASVQRYGLRCSGVAAIFESFIELGAIEQMTARYFESLPQPDWSLEQQIVNSI